MYFCKIASVEELNKKWDYEIEHNVHDRRNWIIWKQQFLENYRNGSILPYYGILDETIICVYQENRSRGVIISLPPDHD